MVNLMAIRNVVGIIGNVISFGLFLSPLPTFVTIWKKKAVEEFSPVPYLATLMNCAIWVFYGLPLVSQNNTLVYTINGIGFVLETIYLILFFIFSLRNNRVKILKILGGEVAFMVVTVGCVIGLAHTLKLKTLIVGILAVFFGTCMYGSPLEKVRDVIRTKSVDYMPFTLSLACFLNGLCWLAYALLKLDIFVLIPNGLGALFGLVQLILYGCYYRPTPTKEDQKSKPELEMSGLKKATVVPEVPAETV